MGRITLFLTEVPPPGAPLEEGTLPRIDGHWLTEVVVVPDSIGAGTEDVTASAETLTEDVTALDDPVAEELPIRTEDAARVVDIGYVVATP